MKRRDFLATGVGIGLAGMTAGCRSSNRSIVRDEALDRVLAQPVLKTGLISQPVRIESVELLKSEGVYFIRSRSSDGAFGISVPNGKIEHLYPILFQLVVPYFLGKDARELEALVDGVALHRSNYKMSSLALWCPVAWVEFSLLDMLGRMAGKHVSALFGSRLRGQVPIYVASGNRDTAPAEEVEILKKQIDRTGARAVKFKIGGRMSRDRDSKAGRSESLIELSRRELGDGIAIQADANGSYSLPKAVEMGRRLEAVRAVLYEEPCPFDWLEETRAVSRALTIAVSGGEQESSEHRFRWMVKNRAVRMVQPDLHYYGGFIRATRVARMAAAAGMTITPHISGGNLGFADMANFCSFTPNIGPFQEYKDGIEKTGPLFDPPLRIRNGMIDVPDAPGMGMAAVEGIMARAKKIY